MKRTLKFLALALILGIATMLMPASAAAAGTPVLTSAYAVMGDDTGGFVAYSGWTGLYHLYIYDSNNTLLNNPDGTISIPLTPGNHTFSFWGDYYFGNPIHAQYANQLGLTLNGASAASLVANDSAGPAHPDWPTAISSTTMGAYVVSVTSFSFTQYSWTNRVSANSTQPDMWPDSWCDSTGSFTINVQLSDNVAPTTTAATSPTPNADGWNKTNAIVNLSAADNAGGSGVKEIRYLVDNINGFRIPGTSCAISLSGEGIHTIEYNAVDNAGNIETTKSFTVKIDKVVPSTSITTPQADGVYANNETLTIVFNASDNRFGSGLDRPAMATLDGTKVSNGDSFELMYLAPGTHTFKVSAMDNAGNTSSSTVTFTIRAVPASTIKVVGKLKATGEIYGSGAEGFANSLTSSLDSVNSSITKGNKNAASNQLDALQNKIAAQKNKSITTKGADSLVAAAQYMQKDLK